MRKRRGASWMERECESGGGGAVEEVWGLMDHDESTGYINTLEYIRPNYLPLTPEPFPIANPR
jgi:hypothetical protein